MKKQLPSLDSINWKPAIKSGLFLLLFVLICGFLAHNLTASETLEEYARNNPELAYGSDEPSTDEPSTDDPDSKTAPDIINSDSTESQHSSEDISGDTNAYNETTADKPEHSMTTQSIDNTNTQKEAMTSQTNDKTDAQKDAMTSQTNDKADAQKDAMTSQTNDKTDERKDTMTKQDITTRVIYKPGFACDELTDLVKDRITGISFPTDDCEITYDDLRYLTLLYYDFDGKVREGEMICNKMIAQDLLEIFYELYCNEYQIEQIHLIDEYNGDDTLSMQDNNTSCFNYRLIDGTDTLSKHAYGLAVDINPFFNPYIVYNKNGSGETYISPEGSEAYADRSKAFAYKIDETDLCYKLFTKHGFTWGGNWNNTKDYQHFQKNITN